MKKLDFKKIKEAWKKVGQLCNPIEKGPKVAKPSPIVNGPVTKTGVRKSRFLDRIIRGIKRPKLKFALSSTKGHYGIFTDYPWTRVQRYLYWYKWSWANFGIDKVPEGELNQTRLAHNIGISWGELIWKDCTKIEKLLIKAKLFWYFLRG